MLGSEGTGHFFHFYFVYFVCFSHAAVQAISSGGSRCAGQLAVLLYLLTCTAVDDCTVFSYIPVVM